MSTTIRVSETTRDRFSRLASSTGRPMTQLVDDAAEALERRLFYDDLTTGFDRLRADPEQWAEIEAERRTEGGAARDQSR